MLSTSMQIFRLIGAVFKNQQKTSAKPRQHYPVRVALRLELRLPAIRDDSVAFELWMAEFVAVAVRPFSSVSLPVR